MKILLLGGSGWLGHNIALLLASKSIDFTIVTRGVKQNFLHKTANFKNMKRR